MESEICGGVTRVVSHALPAFSASAITIIKRLTYIDRQSRFWFWFGKKQDLPRPERLITAYVFDRGLTSRKIIIALGGQEKVEVTLADIAQLLSDQKNGEEEGPLLVDGCYNVFFVRGLNNTIRMLWVSFYERVWCLDAHPQFISGCALDAGYRIFARG
jgi:hypothetical protein